LSFGRWGLRATSGHRVGLYGHRAGTLAPGPDMGQRVGGIGNRGWGLNAPGAGSYGSGIRCRPPKPPPRTPPAGPVRLLAKAGQGPNPTGWCQRRVLPCFGTNTGPSGVKVGDAGPVANRTSPAGAPAGPPATKPAVSARPGRFDPSTSEECGRYWEQPSEAHIWDRALGLILMRVGQERTGRVI